MAEPEPSYNASDARLNKKMEFPLIWLLPLIALAVSSWLVYRALSEKGPLITIVFPTAEGLDVDKTKIRYLDVEVGKVSAIRINDDMKTILVTAQMSSDAADYLTDTTQFWVVKPQVGLAGISGLGTLLSGAYIELKPGKPGTTKDHFVGLTAPPLLKSHVEGTQFILETSDIGSMRPGTPLSFHGINVGEVISQELSKDADSIRLSVFVNAPYDQFVRKHTVFWIDSGISVSAGADGFKLRTGPLISLLSGGITFRTDSKDSPGDIQPENTVFKLFENYEQSTQTVYTNTLRYVMYFNGSVRGLTEGAPVQLRGIPIGSVINVSLEMDKKTAEIRIPVIVELEPDRIHQVNEYPNISDKDVINELIKKGLRAQLQTGSLLTGQLLVDLDFHQNSKIASTATDNIYPEFPTTASSLDQFTHSAQIIMDKVAKLPLDKVTADLENTLVTLQDTSKAGTAMLKTARTTLATTDKTALSAQQMLDSLQPGAGTRYELDRLLLEFTQAASSVRQLADYLQRHPEALLRGKQEDESD
jgi:paraquat-inducible protein B